MYGQKLILFIIKLIMMMSKHIFFILFFLSIGVTAWCQSDLQKGDNCFNSGDYLCAHDNYLKYLSKYPDNKSVQEKLTALIDNKEA